MTHTLAPSHSPSPIQAYFSKALTGEHGWFSWVFGFWLAILVWLVGQNLFGFAMFDALAKIDPEGYKEVLSRSAMEPSDALKILGMATGGLILTAIGIVTYFVGASHGKARKAKRSLLVISGICVGLTSIGLGAIIAGNNPQDVEVITRNIGNSKMIYIAMLLGFPPLIGGLWMAVKLVQKRPFLSVLTAASHFRWRRLFFSMIVFWGVVGCFTLLGHLTGLNNISVVFDPSRFFAYALISLLLIPIQSATEEIILRGYLNQGLGKYIKSPWIVFIITSGMFAALHLGNPEAVAGSEDGKALITMSSYFFFGFFACILTYIDGGLESAIGIHAANNLYASIVLGYENSALPTPTVLHTTLNPSSDALITLLSLAIVCAILWRYRETIN